MTRFSRFGERFSRRTGARELMDDLGSALASDEPVAMLGGGNPALIPEVQEILRTRLRGVIANDRDFRRMVGDYAHPTGEISFRNALAEFLQREYGWAVGSRNIALTGGSQSAFFQLFNLLGGAGSDGVNRRILLPMTPEYIGYKDVGVADGLFAAQRAIIEELPDRLFKYQLDIGALAARPDIGAVCVSRPTNPSGNVLTDSEMAAIARVSEAMHAPLIVDGAYGLPFPGIVHVDAAPWWSPNSILCLSLSKLGLPGVRTGIVIAPEDIIDALSGMNATMSLAVSSVGPVIVRDLLVDGEIVRMSRDLIRPYYARRARESLDLLREVLDGLPFRIHKPEGAFFLWVWFPGLPVSSSEIYERLKARRVMVLSGHHFFPGLGEPWPHSEECLRISYTQSPEVFRHGVQIVAEEVRRAFG
jgi:valine--pyruvate aminotransferase